MADYISIKNKKFKFYKIDTLVVGSGAAGFNAVDWLYDLNCDNIALATEGMNVGTSRNTGSDKQTYYKLSVSADDCDCVKDMANSLFSGGCVNGDTAYAEAANSIKSFMKLVNLGVPFPTNEFGDFVGYQTDHDAHKRATSAGPLTSKYMTEALQKQVEKKNIKIFDKMLIFKLITIDGKISGALGIDKTRMNEDDAGITVFECKNIVVATGGPAYLYEGSVYPLGHTGMSGMVLELGADSANLQEWQYGLASVDFRWNVSGTYQQVLPRYITIDDDGNEREFLYDYFEKDEDAINNVFMKGYQWPFDSAKIKGSSIIDLIIYNETVVKKNKVYMDFRYEPKALESGFGILSEEAYGYLESSEALIKTPIKRLEKMNIKAIELYKSHGIDLYTQPLRVEVCAQHNNGGIAVDVNWQTNIEGLYVVGEAAGTFGPYRPGGTALNSTQVGSMRAAEHIAFKEDVDYVNETIFVNAVNKDCGEIIENLILSGNENGFDPISKMRVLQHNMSSFAAYIRNKKEIYNLKEETKAELDNLYSNMKKTPRNKLPLVLKLRDMLITRGAALSAMEMGLDVFGSHGGYVGIDGNNYIENILDCTFTIKKECDNVIIRTQKQNDNHISKTVPVRPMPNPDTWFEKVWNNYMIKRGIKK